MCKFTVNADLIFLRSNLYMYPFWTSPNYFVQLRWNCSSAVKIDLTVMCGREWDIADLHNVWNIPTQVGDRWRVDDCTECRCMGRDVECLTQKCPPLDCDPSDIATATPGSCCPVCITSKKEGLIFSFLNVYVWLHCDDKVLRKAGQQVYWPWYVFLSMLLFCLWSLNRGNISFTQT